jgi:beta-propeller repeat-containing protein
MVLPVLVMALMAVATAAWTGSEPAPAGFVSDREGRVVERAAATAHAKLPLAFVGNRGQTDARVRYYAQGSRYGFYLTRRELVLSLVKGSDPSDPRGVALALRFLGANPRVALEGEERAPGKVNSLRGSDPARWRTGLPSFARIVYRKLWPGVDMVLRGRGGELKYEFRVRPGARPADIRLAYRGADGLVKDGAGGLSIKTAMGALRDSPPVAYQEIGGLRVPVESRYVLKGGGGVNRSYGFALGAGYDPDHEFIIDPGLAYSTFLGGSSHESGNDIAVDASGNAYVTGLTQSPNFPTTAGAFDRTGAASNNLDVFVSKLNATGTALVYSTFIGGSNFDWWRGLAIDGAGNAYVTGQTKSSNFPTTGGAFDKSFNIDNCPRCGIDQYDAFVAKLNPSGSRLVYSTFLGGTDFDDSFGIALDGAANVYVTGQTGSRNFPTTPGAFDITANGSYDGFVTKLNAAGSGLVYSTRLGGAENELPENVAVDAAGNAYVGGSTRSADFPTTPGAFDTTHNGGAFDELFDLFATKLNAGGSALVYSTFLGGSKSDFGSDFAVDTAAAPMSPARRSPLTSRRPPAPSILSLPGTARDSSPS